MNCTQCHLISNIRLENTRHNDEVNCFQCHLTSNICYLFLYTFNSRTSKYELYSVSIFFLLGRFLQPRVTWMLVKRILLSASFNTFPKEGHTEGRQFVTGSDRAWFSASVQGTCYLRIFGLQLRMSE